MATSEELLEAAARDGSLDIGEWPKVLENVLQRLHDIVYSEFPLPPKAVQLPSSIDRGLDVGNFGASPIPEPSPSQISRRVDSEAATDSEPASQNTQRADPPRSAPSTALDVASATTPSKDDDDDLQQTYPDLAASYQSSIKTLKTSFAEGPPYTIQRLAELVLYPRRHYRFLPPYLNALDRVVSVSSSTSSFPLIHHLPASNGMFMPDGEEETINGPSGDEGLGGALLTPIPWLRNVNHSEEHLGRQSDGELHSEGSETIEGPNGTGRVETVSVTVNGISSTPHGSNGSGHNEGTNGGMTTEQELREQGAVTQGELLRQEQEAGVVPVAQTTSRRGLAGSLSGAMGPHAHIGAEDEEGEDAPHARGPDEIGMEDLGPQEGALGTGRPLDIDAALGKQKSPSPQPEEKANAAPADAEGRVDSEEKGSDEATQQQDADGDYVLVNAEDQSS